MIELDGDIRGTPIDIKIPVEDVEPTAVLDFPLTSSEGTADIAALKNAISSLQQDVSKLQSEETKITSNDGAAYDFAIFGLSIAAAAIILAIVALIKRK
jgi:aspartyl-tRNA synthetase